MDESPVKLKSDRVLGWVVLPVVALVLMFAPMPDWAINGFYADSVYPQLQRVVTSGTNFLPFAMLDVLIVAALLLTLFTILRLLRKASNVGFVDAIWDGSRRLLRGAAIIVILFLVGWGYNYRRQPLEQRFPDGRAAAPTVEALQAAVLDANTLAAKLRRTIGQNMDQRYDEVAGRSMRRCAPRSNSCSSRRSVSPAGRSTRSC